MFTPLVSIIIPVYNGANYMREAIDSALNQTYKNIEVIVVNDGSKDNTEEIAQSYGDKIRYFAKENGGVATALNLAIKEAKGDYISWLSHDDMYTTNKIQRQIEELNTLDDKNTILYSDYMVIDKNSKIKGYFYIKAAHPLHKLNLPLYPIYNGIIHGCTLLIPKKCFFEVGFFDEKLKTTQDYDLWYRMFPNYKICYINEWLVKSRTHSEQGSNKITSAKDEASELWIRMLSSLSDEDIFTFEGSKLAFWQKTYNLMEGAGYIKAKEWIEPKLKDIKSKLSYSENIKVSVIIPFYNRVECLKNAINSVLKQSHTNFELILVDDYSDLDISEIKEIANNNPKISLYTNEHKKGASGARNTGIEKATGDYIAFLDSDDLFIGEKIKEQLEFMVTNDYMISNTYYQIDDKTNVYFPEFIKGEEVSYPNIIAGCNVATPTVMINKEVFSEFNFRFNEDYKYGEDVCLWIDISKRFTIKTLQKILTTVNKNGSNVVDNPSKLVIGVSNIFNHAADEQTVKLYSKELYVLQHFYIDKNLKEILEKEGHFISKYKLTRLLYRILARPILKKKYGRAVTKEKFDKKYT